MNAHTAGSVYEPALKILSPLCSLFNSSNCVKVSLNAAVNKPGRLGQNHFRCSYLPQGQGFRREQRWGNTLDVG